MNDLVISMRPIETIVAPATPPGEGGVAIVRLSGPGAESMLAQVFFGKTAPAVMASHRLYHGWLRHPEGHLLDEVLAVIMRAPHSYTGEDVVEVHCHGGSQILRNILDTFLDLQARMARPGEFTERAFLNGRLDLAQAEAVAGLIGARSTQASRVALDQLEGRVSREVYRSSDQIKALLALVEAHVDFPDDDVGSLDLMAVEQKLQTVASEVNLLVSSFDTGRALREGINVLILGRPNVGKSSLMNALLGQARAIVTDVPGTTRDTVEEQMVIGGFPVRLIDTAGVRSTEDPVEREGVRRASDKAHSADLVLLVVDGSQTVTEADRMALALCDPDRTLAVVNKVDLSQQFDRAELLAFGRVVEVSARSGTDLDVLQQAMVERLGGKGAADVGEHVVLSERRHRDALLQALRALQSTLDALGAQQPLECIAFELREILDCFGLVTGETTPDEILNQIFGQFCIGK